MLIAQVTDLHLHADAGHPNLARFERVLDHLLSLRPRPDLLVLSGDLADDGAPASYRHLRQALARWPGALRLALGNHDRREHFQAVFGAEHGAQGFVQDSGALGELRIVVLDTLDEGRSGGAFCEARAAWLRQVVQDSGSAPLLVFLHHPPVAVGIPWIEPGPAEPWIARLDAALQDANIAAICSGHVHLGGVFRWRGRQVLTCPSSSSDLSLDFTTMQPGLPDGRPLVEQGEPAFALHRWEDGGLATVFGRCPQRVLARWDGATDPMVSEMLGERSPPG